MTGMLSEEGTAQLVFTNTKDNALTRLFKHLIDIAAGPDRAVAATKPFVSSILARLWLVAHRP